MSTDTCSKFLSRMSAARYRILPRAGPLIPDQPGKAAAAAEAASSTSRAVPFTKLPTSSSVFAGFRFSNKAPLPAHSPSI